MNEWMKDSINILHSLRELLDEDVILHTASYFGCYFTELQIAGKTVAWCEQDDYQVNRMLEAFYNGLTYTYK